MVSQIEVNELIAKARTTREGNRLLEAASRRGIDLDASRHSARQRDTIYRAVSGLKIGMDHGHLAQNIREQEMKVKGKTLAVTRGDTTVTRTGRVTVRNATGAVVQQATPQSARRYIKDVETIRRTEAGLRLHQQETAEKQAEGIYEKQFDYWKDKKDKQYAETVADREMLKTPYAQKTLERLEYQRWKADDKRGKEGEPTIHKYEIKHPIKSGVLGEKYSDFAEKRIKQIKGAGKKVSSYAPSVVPYVKTKYSQTQDILKGGEYVSKKGKKVTLLKTKDTTVPVLNLKGGTQLFDYQKVKGGKVGTKHSYILSKEFEQEREKGIGKGYDYLIKKVEKRQPDKWKQKEFVSTGKPLQFEWKDKTVTKRGWVAGMKRSRQFTKGFSTGITTEIREKPTKLALIAGVSYGVQGLAAPILKTVGASVGWKAPVSRGFVTTGKVAATGTKAALGAGYLTSVAYRVSKAPTPYKAGKTAGAIVPEVTAIYAGAIAGQKYSPLKFVQREAAIKSSQIASLERKDLAKLMKKTSVIPRRLHGATVSKKMIQQPTGKLGKLIKGRTLFGARSQQLWTPKQTKWYEPGTIKRMIKKGKLVALRGQPRVMKDVDIVLKPFETEKAFTAKAKALGFKTDPHSYAEFKLRSIPGFSKRALKIGKGIKIIPPGEQISRKFFGLSTVRDQSYYRFPKDIVDLGTGAKVLKQYGVHRYSGLPYSPTTKLKLGKAIKAIETFTPMKDPKAAYWFGDKTPRVTLEDFATTVPYSTGKSASFLPMFFKADSLIPQRKTFVKSMKSIKSPSPSSYISSSSLRSISPSMSSSVSPSLSISPSISPSVSPSISPSISPSSSLSSSLSPSPSSSPSPSISPSISPSPSPSPSVSPSPSYSPQTQQPIALLFPLLPKDKKKKKKKPKQIKFTQIKKRTPTVHAILGGIKKQVTTKEFKKLQKKTYTGIEQRPILEIKRRKK